MNKAIISALIGLSASAVLSLSAFGGSREDTHHAAEHRHAPAAAPTHEHGGNPLIEEMVILDGVFRDVVSAVSLGDGRRVHDALEKMHGTMEKTHAGVKHGTVTLKKNTNRMNEFVAQDKEFHVKLEALALAGHKNDQAAMLTLTKDLLDRCAKCHKDFR